MQSYIAVIKLRKVSLALSLAFEANVLSLGYGKISFKTICFSA